MMKKKEKKNSSKHNVLNRPEVLFKHKGHMRYAVQKGNDVKTPQQTVTLPPQEASPGHECHPYRSNER